MLRYDRHDRRVGWHEEHITSTGRWPPMSQGGRTRLDLEMTRAVARVRPRGQTERRAWAKSHASFHHISPPRQVISPTLQRLSDRGDRLHLDQELLAQQ